MFVTSLISLAGWVTIYMSNSYVQILIGRSISGISTGMASVPTTVYVAEIAGPKLRGTMVTWTSISIALGVLIVYIFGYFFQVNDQWHWFVHNTQKKIIQINNHCLIYTEKKMIVGINYNLTIYHSLFNACRLYIYYCSFHANYYLLVIVTNTKYIFSM